MGTLIEDGHLGGFVAGGDPLTFYPKLWAWMVKDLGVESVLDIGCGNGQAAAYFRDLGCSVLGLDGSEKAGTELSSNEFLLHDLVAGPCFCRGKYSSVWCCEVAEHVEERYVHNLLLTIVANVRDVVFFSHALPGQGGYHHVNCKPPEYWLAQFALFGCEIDEPTTNTARRLAHGYFSRTGIVFRPKFLHGG